MSNKTKLFATDKSHLIHIASITMFIHVLCGLLRYLIDIRFVLPLDYTTTGLLIVYTLLYCIRNKTRLFSSLKSKLGLHLLAFMFAWFILSQMANVILRSPKSAYYAPNAILDTLLLFFVFFPFGCSIVQNGVPQIGKRLFIALLFIWSLFMLYVVVNALMNRVISLPGGIRLGIYGNKKLNLNNNSNHTSCFEFVFFCLCAFMAYISKKYSIRIMYIFFCVIHYFGLVLSDSRAFFLATSVFCSGMSFYWALRRLQNKAIWSRILFSALLAIVIAGLLYLMRLAVYEIYSYTARLAGAESIFKQKAIRDENFSNLHGRTDIWANCIKELFSKPVTFFFGEGIANSKQITLRQFGQELYTHNQFIEVAICAGVPALVGLLAFLILLFRNAFLILLEKPVIMAHVFIVLSICVLLLANCVEALLMFYRRPGSYVFFLCSGWLCEYTRQKTRISKLNKQYNVFG